MLLTGLALVAGLVGSALLGSPPARAQLAVAPGSLSVVVPQHETVERTVTLANTGAEPLTFCLSFDRPLQRTSGSTRLSDAAEAVVGAACGTYGEVLHRLGDEDGGVPDSGWLPFGLAMTAEGRLFTSSISGLHRTFELTPALGYVRYFEHPTEEELDNSPATWGIAYDETSGTLWWLNEEAFGNDPPERNLLLEGDLDGNPTGRRIELPTEHEGEVAYALGPSYDPATDRFYYAGWVFSGTSLVDDLVWAVDREGTVVEGYPVEQAAYPARLTGRGVDAHGGAGGDPEGVRLEVGVQVPNDDDFDRVVVLDRWGNSEGETLETPVPAEIRGPAFGGINANPLRSRLDPNGVMYMTYASTDDQGVVAVRPHPLPPSWLVVDSEAGPEAAWDGALAPGESREVVLTFRAGARAVGTYTSSLQAFEAATGEAIEVPLSLTVTKGTDAEEVAEPARARLSVWPNPSGGAATVALELGSSAEAKVAVYDVLGRRVAVLHEGRLGAGEHALHFDAAGRPAGLYLVRVVGEGLYLTRTITVLR